MVIIVGVNGGGKTTSLGKTLIIAVTSSLLSFKIKPLLF